MLIEFILPFCLVLSTCLLGQNNLSNIVFTKSKLGSSSTTFTKYPRNNLSQLLNGYENCSFITMCLCPWKARAVWRENKYIVLRPKKSPAYLVFISPRLQFVNLQYKFSNIPSEAWNRIRGETLKTHMKRSSITQKQKQK